MDGLATMPRDAQIVLAGALVYAVVSFLNWQVERIVGLTVVQSEWAGIGILAGFVGWALLAWEISRAAEAQFSVRGVSKAATSLVLALLLALLTLITFLVHADGRNWPAWLGLAVALGIAAVAWGRARREGVQLPSARA